MDTLEKKLGYSFRNRELLKIALTHRSFNEGKHDRQQEDNEKLEFLGDSVVNLIVTEYLFRKFKRLREGELSKLKAHLVSSDFLNDAANSIALSDYLFLGKGEEKNRGRNNKKIVSSLFEAVVGAVYMDSNFKVTYTVFIPFFKGFLAKIKDKDVRINDHKSELQEVIQKTRNIAPTYEIVSEQGKPPDVVFEAVAMLDGREIGKGVGRNKRQAEQEAAAAALEKISDYDEYKKLSEVFFLKNDQDSKEQKI